MERHESHSQHCPAAIAIQMRKANAVGLFWSIPRIVSMVTILSVAVNQTCDQPLHLWIVVLLCQDVLRFPLRIHILRCIKRLELSFDPHSIDFERGLTQLTRSIPFVAGRWCSHLVLGWYVCGVVWTFSCETCASTAPELFRLSLALVIILFTFVGINFLCGCFYVILVVCLRIFGARFLRMRGAQQFAGMAGIQASRGATAEDISELPLFPFSQESATFDTTCSVCLCEYEEEEQLRKFPCNHVFHGTCSDRWLQLSKRCPLCNQYIDAPSTTAVDEAGGGGDGGDGDAGGDGAGQGGVAAASEGAAGDGAGVVGGGSGGGSTDDSTGAIPALPPPAASSPSNITSPSRFNSASGGVVDRPEGAGEGDRDQLLVLQSTSSSAATSPARPSPQVLLDCASSDYMSVVPTSTGTSGKEGKRDAGKEGKVGERKDERAPGSAPGQAPEVPAAEAVTATAGGGEGVTPDAAPVTSHRRSSGGGDGTGFPPQVHHTISDAAGAGAAAATTTVAGASSAGGDDGRRSSVADMYARGPRSLDMAMLGLSGVETGSLAHRASRSRVQPLVNGSGGGGGVVGIVVAPAPSSAPSSRHGGVLGGSMTVAVSSAPTTPTGARHRGSTSSFIEELL